MPREMNAQNEAADTLVLWKATYAELFPHRNPDAMRVEDAALALALMLRREMKAGPGVVRERIIGRFPAYSGVSE